MKSLKNVLAALAFVFAFGAAFALSPEINDGKYYGDPGSSVEPLAPGFTVSNCTATAGSVRCFVILNDEEVPAFHDQANNIEAWRP